MNKADPNAKKLLKNTDLLAAQSIQYRRLSANLYRTKNPGEYYHIHGSLEATKTLNMIGLEGHRPDMTDYRECIDLIESHVMRYTSDELEKLNAENKQAGVPCLKPEEFDSTPHVSHPIHSPSVAPYFLFLVHVRFWSLNEIQLQGQVLNKEPPWRITAIEQSSPPVPFPPPSSSTTIKPQILTGIKVLELCRIVAGPSMGRGLAEYGASVLKVTSPYLSDVPFFQVDGNLGKHAADLDLHNPTDRKTFEALLQEADVVLDGYRPGSLERLGYGPKQVVELTKGRGRGIVYVAEDCFGHTGEWAERPGWQQIADCVTGVAWLQGRMMGLDEPVIPPFPMSDYGTGCMGTIAALVGLWNRAKHGGSWHGTTSLCQYDIFLLGLGTYAEELQEELKRTHDKEFFALRHSDSVDEVGRRALKTMQRVHPELFEDEHFHRAWSEKYNAEIKFVKPVADIEGTWNGFLRCSRPNGSDPASWEGWEIDEGMLHD